MTDMPAFTASQRPQGPITGQVLLYSRPEPLSPEAHGKLGIERSETPFAFAFNASAMPCHVSEFGPAASCYPIIFAGNDKTPVCVMGIRDAENLYIASDGRYENDAYLPSFLRRYPFVVAADPNSDQMVVCIDRDAAMLTEKGELRLFDAGQPSDFTKNAIQFCTDFEAERVRTESFVNLLKTLDLFEVHQQMFIPREPDGTTGEPVQLAEFFRVSEPRLKALPSEKIMDLMETGALQQIYAHLNSQFNWDRLVARTLARGPQQQPGHG